MAFYRLRNTDELLKPLGRVKECTIGYEEVVDAEAGLSNCGDVDCPASIKVREVDRQMQAFGGKAYGGKPMLRVRVCHCVYHLNK